MLYVPYHTEDRVGDMVGLVVPDKVQGTVEQELDTVSILLLGKLNKVSSHCTMRRMASSCKGSRPHKAYPSTRKDHSCRMEHSL